MEDEPVKLTRGRWLNRRLAIGVLVVGVVGGFLYWFPPWAIERAKHNSIDCTNQIYRTGTGTASDCEQGGLLAIPKLVPWTRKRARKVQSGIRGRAIEDAIDLATKRDLDRAAADRGVVALFAALRDDPDLDMNHATYYVVEKAGGEPALLAHAAELTSSSDQDKVLAAAIHAGDRDAALRTVRTPPTGAPSFTVEKTRGAVLCAFGDKAAGVAALTKAIELFGKLGSTSYLEAQVALAACEPSVDLAVDSVWAGQVSYAKQIGGGAPEPLHEPYNDDADDAALVVLDRAGNDQLHDYLRIIAPSFGGTLRPRFEAMSPWSILSSEGDYPTAPGWDDAAAARLIGFADTFVPAKPSKHKRGDDDLAFRVSQDYDIDDDAEHDPRAYLRWSAMIVSLDAAVGWARRGDLTHAQASAAVAVACASHADAAAFHPYSDLVLIPVLHLVGRESDAMAAIDAVLAKLPPGPSQMRGVLSIEKVLILLRAGKPDEAWNVFGPELIANGDGPVWSLAWLRAATALMLGKPVDFKLADVPADRDYSADHPDVNLAYWYTAATDPALQPMRRWKHDGLDPGYFDNWGVLPALLYVVGKAAGKGDVELWLDVVTANDIIPWDAMASARAEAARWRGDAAAATAWDQRLATYRALATDDKTAYLLRLAQKN